MAWSLDARIPVTILGSAEALAAALAQGRPAAVLATGPVAGGVVQGRFAATPPHQPGCGCCTGRSPAALELDRLFQARIRNQCPWFDRVLALAEDAATVAAIQQALMADALTAARYRAA